MYCCIVALLYPAVKTDAPGLACCPTVPGQRNRPDSLLRDTPIPLNTVAQGCTQGLHHTLWLPCHLRKNTVSCLFAFFVLQVS